MDVSDEMVRIARNVASVVAVPWEVLGDGPARFLLVEMAYAGLDVRVCADCEGIWYVHLGGQQMTSCEWAAKFAA